MASATRDLFSISAHEVFLFYLPTFWEPLELTAFYYSLHHPISLINQMNDSQQ